MVQELSRKRFGFGSLIVAGLLVSALTLTGCKGDDGSNGKDGVAGQDFQAPANEFAGVNACLTCHGATIAPDHILSAHVVHSTHVSRTSGATCMECHDPLLEGTKLERYLDAENIPAGGLAAVTCEACHGESSNHVDLPGMYKPTFAKPDIVNCGSCHTTIPDSHIPHHPFAQEISERFATSRHGNQRARAGFCSACHSHEGGVELLAKPRQTSLAGLQAIYTEDSIEAYSLPVGSEAIVGVMKKDCATCHDSHSTELRGDGDVLASATTVTGFLSEAGTPIDNEVRVAYSAEFNLCTACHMVELDATWDATAGYSSRGMITYELSAAYTAANLVDAETGTFDLSKKVFYHDGASGNGRTMVDTHFGGTIVRHMVEFPTVESGEVDEDGNPIMEMPPEGLEDIVIKGYNINPGSPNACTICHDPHTGGKMLAPEDGEFPAQNADTLDNKAVGFAEGLGDFHTDYLADNFSRNQTGCNPCHTGTDFVKVTAGATSAAERWNVVGCRSCHDLAVANSTPNSNDAAAFAQVRTFPADYVFAFNSGVEVAVADLGVNQVCFECHKGRTGYDDAAFEARAEDPAGTRGYDASYFHYAPSMAVLFGADSGMLPTYTGKTYAGRFSHPFAIDGVQAFGCADCHNVHSTEGNQAYESRMSTAAECSGCHTSGATSVANLQARLDEFSDRLLLTILAEVMEYAPGGANEADYAALNAGLQATIDALDAALAADRPQIMMTHIEGRTSYLPTKKIAKAANVWKIFTYEDGAPNGPTHHGHGGAWAHNSKYARQVMYDAIEDLGGDLTGLTPRL